MIHKSQIKASSLMNAILVCLVISIFCGCLVLISHYQNLINKKLYLQEEIINRNNSVFTEYLSKLETVDYDKTQETDLFSDGILSYVTKKNWGFYDVLVSKTIFRNDTLSKISLVGKRSDKSKPIALFVTDYDKPIKFSGNIEITGNIHIPNGHTEQAYINGIKGNTIQIKGQQLPSDSKLPKIDKNISIDWSVYKTLSLKVLKSDTLINTFDKETIVLNLSDISTLKNIICKGNIIIASNTSLTITNTSILNDVLIIAPKIVFQSGFKGNVQVIAKELVEIEEEVRLEYPSSIYIKNDTDSVSVKIHKKSILMGGIVIDGDTYQGSLNRKLIIDENARVIGTIYNYGKTQLQGEVIGTMYTDRLFLETSSSDYENVMLNVTINRDSLPKMFLELPLFKSNTNTYEIIKKF
jgi:hypothetical protein